MLEQPPSNLVDEDRHLGWRLAALVGLALLVCLPSLIWNAYPSKDTAFFYSRMIREIAAGNFQGGYYPLIPPLFSTVGGALAAATGLSGFAAARLTSALFFAATVLPLYALMRRFFPRRPAWIACLLYVGSPLLVRYAGSGLLDTGKTFFLVLAVWLAMAFADRPGYRLAVAFGFACGGLTLIKGEGLPIVVAIVGILHLCRWRQAGNWRAIWPDRHLLLAALAFLVALAPWLAYVQRQTGFPLPDGRQALVFAQALNRLGYGCGRPGNLPGEPDEIHQLLAPKWSNSPFIAGISSREFWDDLAKQVIDGLNPFYLALCLIALAAHWRACRWRGGDWILLATIVLHTLLLLAVTNFRWTEKRYVVHAMPFLLGWAALGTTAVLDWLDRRLPRRAAKWLPALALAVLLAVAVVRGNSSAIKEARRVRSNPELRIAMGVRDWFARQAPASARPTGLLSTTRQYHTGRRPLVAGIDQRLLYFAGGDAVLLLMYGANLTVDELATVCRLKQVDFLLWPSPTTRTHEAFSPYHGLYPDLDNLGAHPAFRLAARLPATADAPAVLHVYAYEPPSPTGLQKQSRSWRPAGAHERADSANTFPPQLSPAEVMP